MSPSKIFIIELMIDKFTEMVMPAASRKGILALIKKMVRVKKGYQLKKDAAGIRFTQGKIDSLIKSLKITSK